MLSPESRRLKQARLPFIVLKKDSSAAKKTQIKSAKKEEDLAENKENVSSKTKRSTDQQENAQAIMKSEAMIVDLTGDSRDANDVNMTKEQTHLSSGEMIDQVIDKVIKRAAEGAFPSPTKLENPNESLSAKKRRRRSRSPVTPEAKRARCDKNGIVKTPTQAIPESTENSTKPVYVVPEIIVTKATPIGKDKSALKRAVLESFFNQLLTENSSKQEDDDEGQKAKRFNAVVNMVTGKKHRAKQNTKENEALNEAECQNKEKTTKYPPLSSVLARKRPRSTSPTAPRTQNETIKKFATEKALQNDNAEIVKKFKVEKPEDTELVPIQERGDNESEAEKETNSSTEVKVEADGIHPVENSKVDRAEDSQKEEKPKDITSCETPKSSKNTSEQDNVVTASSPEEKCDKKESSTEQTTVESPPSSLKKSSETGSMKTPSPPQENGSMKKVTPKSGSKSQRSLQAQLKREEKEKEKEERKKQREEQRLAKEKEKQELMKKKEEEKARKEEERKKKKEEEEAAKAERLRKLEEKKREKEKLEQEKKLEKERKEEERRKEKERKEEEKRQKELEKQKIEKEKQQVEEEKRRKSEKRAETFKSFFKSPTRSPSVNKKVVENVGIFAPFQPKEGMKLAPVRRRKINASQKEQLDEAMEGQNFVSSYLRGILSKPRTVEPPTWASFRRKLVSLAEDGLELIENDGDSKPGVKILRAKFLSFHTNYRPPYYGTWRKESKVLSYKNPFKKDNGLFDYEFDSDDEWEEPAEGEDIANSDGEDEGDGNEEDEDDGFFVPHGYLSDDEGINEEEGEEDGLKPDHKLKQKQLEFEASFKRKLSHLTPIVIGCVWKDSAESLDKVHREILNNYKPEFLRPTPIEIHPRSSTPDNLSESPPEGTKSDQSRKASKSVPEEAMTDLIRLLHGNPLALPRIVNEFRAYWKLKKSSSEPINYGPMSLEDPLDEEDEKMETDVPQNSILKAENTTIISSKSPAEGPSTENITATPNACDPTHEISKTQMMKKCKEIAGYSRKDNMNRACWFVKDSVLEMYDMTDGKAPIPCKWNYVTDVRKIQILIFPVAGSKQNTAAPVEPPQRQSPAPNIAKFAAKVTPNVILEQSKLKHEKEKQAQALVASISKFTVEKISPNVIIEKSAQRIAEEMLKAKAAMELEAEKAAKNVPHASQPQEGNYIIPTPEAMRSLFRIDSAGVVELTSDTSKDGHN